MVGRRGSRGAARRALERELDAGLEGDGRRYVVAAPAASDPTFDGDVAVGCLWDCEAQTRRLAATHVDRRVRLAAQRLEELAGDAAQAASLRAAALARRRE